MRSASAIPTRGQKHVELQGCAGRRCRRSSCPRPLLLAHPLGRRARPRCGEGGGTATVRYNHYKEKFQIVDGRLDFRLVDSKYSLSYVFKGTFCCRLASDAKGEGSFGPEGGALSFSVDDEGDRVAGGTFCGLKADGEYFLLVDEDPKHAAEKGTPYKAASSKKGGRGRGGLGGSSSITAELKKMSAEQLRAASSGGEGSATTERYRRLATWRTRCATTTTTIGTRTPGWCWGGQIVLLMSLAIRARRPPTVKTGRTVSRWQSATGGRASDVWNWKRATTVGNSRFWRDSDSSIQTRMFS